MCVCVRVRVCVCVCVCVCVLIIMSDCDHSVLITLSKSHCPDDHNVNVLSARSLSSLESAGTVTS